jgi:hypothetical protein
MGRARPASHSHRRRNSARHARYGRATLRSSLRTRGGLICAAR